MKKVYLFTPYPTIDKPNDHKFIEHRVNVLKNHYNLTVITINYNQKSTKKIEYEKHEKYTIIKLNIKLYSIKKLNFFVREHQIGKLLNILIKENPPDLIHIHFSGYHSWIVNKVCKKYKIPFVITEHSSGFETNIKQFYVGSKIIKTIKDADCVISVSQSLQTTIQKHIKREVIVIPNVVDIKKFEMILKTESDTDKVKLITIGGLDETDKKGYELLLKTLKKLQENNYRIECKIIGDGPNYNNLKNIIKNYNLKNTELLGSIDNDLLPNYYNDSHFFVSSSKKETFGVVIIEAMSCGLPIVSTKSGGPEEFVTKKVGILSDQTPNSLYASLVKMINSYNLYDSLHIRNIVEENYSEQAYYNKISKIYNELLK